MRLLILGGSGMLGHQLWRSLHERHEVWVTLRRPVTDFAQHQLFDPGKSIQVNDIIDDAALDQALGLYCVGVWGGAPFRLSAAWSFAAQRRKSFVAWPSRET